MTQEREDPAPAQFLIRNLKHRRRKGTVEFPSHPADPYLVVPPYLVQDLSIRPVGRRTFFLPDGTETSRDLGWAELSWDGRGWTRIEIIFGEEGDFPRSRRGPLALKGTCPNCGPTRVIRLLVGLPTREATESVRRGELAFGGCVVYPGMPRFVCSVCRAAVPELGMQS